MPCYTGVCWDLCWAGRMECLGYVIGIQNVFLHVIGFSRTTSGQIRQELLWAKHWPFVPKMRLRFRNLLGTWNHSTTQKGGYFHVSRTSNSVVKFHKFYKTVQRAYKPRPSSIPMPSSQYLRNTCHMLPYDIMPNVHQHSLETRVAIKEIGQAIQEESRAPSRSRTRCNA